MTAEKEKVPMIESPPPPSATRTAVTSLRPEDYSPELAKAKLAQSFFEKLAPFMIVSKKFVVYHGIWKGLNHTQDNKTGYNCSLRLVIYDAVGKGTPNIDGRSFDAAGTYLSSATVVVNQITPQSASTFNTEPGFFERVKNRIFGGGETNAKPDNR